jgi:hypothetical protein
MTQSSGELLAAEELVDQLLALVRGAVGHEAVEVLAPGKHPDDVQVGAAEERLVRAELARKQPAGSSAC